MTSTEELVKDTLTAWAEEAQVPHDLANQALRKRSWIRVRTTITVAALAAAAIAGAVTLPSVIWKDDRPVVAAPTASGPEIPRADPGSAPPVTLVAAGHLALSAYSSCGYAGGCTWHLYDPTVGSYTTTEFGWVAVAPGGKQAAVLEKQLPASRIGIADTTGGQVRRWIDLDRAAAGGLAWSPDGSKLLVTAYDRDPEQLVPDYEKREEGGRIGFFVVDVQSGQTSFYNLPGVPAPGLPYRDDLLWSSDGSLVWEWTGQGPTPKRFYDLQGKVQAGPDEEAYTDQPAGLSPDGLHLAVGSKSGSEPSVADVPTGDTVVLRSQREYMIQQLVAWTDDAHLIAWAFDRDTYGTDAARARLVLVDVNGSQITPLTGWFDHNAGVAWTPVFTTTN